MLKPMSLRWTVVPGNSGFVIPFDSTRGPHDMTWGAIASGSAYLAPGKMRGVYAGMKAAMSIRCTGQNVQADWQIKTGNAGTSADWESQGGAGVGVHTVTAGTTFTGEFKPLAPEWRVLLTAGGAGPTTCEVEMHIMPSADHGSYGTIRTLEHLAART